MTSFDMNKKILFLPGDGVGPEIINQAKKVMDAVSDRFGHNFSYEEGLIGAIAIDEAGMPYPAETQKLVKQVDTILLGAVGDPKYDKPSHKIRPEQGLLSIRQDLELFANLRPIKIFDSLIDSSPLRPEVIGATDLIFFRELTGGIYFGKPRERLKGGEGALDTMVYTKREVRRIAKLAFDAARERNKKVTSVDKANVLECSRLWREVVDHVAKDYPDIQYEHQLVDSATMRLVKDPSSFDVILTSNLFGDVLSDEAAAIGGSLGMMASASIGERFSLYEPAHGSAPDIAGEDVANPIATILSVEMMMRLTFGMKEEADSILEAVNKVLLNGYRTRDIKNNETKDRLIVGTEKMGDLIATNIAD